MATNDTFANFVSLLRNSTVRPRVGLAPAESSDLVSGLLASQPATAAGASGSTQRGRPANAATPVPITSVDAAAQRDAARLQQLQTAGAISSPGYRAHLDAEKRNKNMPSSRTSNAEWEEMFPKRATDNYLQPGQSPDPEARMRTFRQMQERGVAPTVGRVAPNIVSDRPETLPGISFDPLYNPDLSAAKGGAVYSTPYGTIGRVDGQPIPDTSSMPRVPGNYYELTPPGGSSVNSAPTVAPGAPVSGVSAAPVAGVSGAPVSAANSTRPGPVNDPYNSMPVSRPNEFELDRPSVESFFGTNSASAGESIGATAGTALNNALNSVFIGGNRTPAAPTQQPSNVNPQLVSSILSMVMPQVLQQAAPELSVLSNQRPNR